MKVYHGSLVQSCERLIFQQSLYEILMEYSVHYDEYAFLYSLIRLEFNSEQCGYYTELDGVELRGCKSSGMHMKTHVYSILHS